MLEILLHTSELIVIGRVSSLFSFLSSSPTSSTTHANAAFNSQPTKIFISKIASMEPTTLLIWAFIALSLAIKFAWEKIELFLHSNFKYRVINYLASYIYYGDDIGILIGNYFTDF